MEKKTIKWVCGVCRWEKEYYSEKGLKAAVTLGVRCKECERKTKEEVKRRRKEQKRAEKVTTTRWVCADCGHGEEYGDEYMASLEKKGMGIECVRCRHIQRWGSCKVCKATLPRMSKDRKNGMCNRCYLEMATIIPFHDGVSLPCKGCQKPMIYHRRESFRYAYLQRGVYCPRCLLSCPKSEREIMKFLEDRGLFYEHQKTFENCVNPATGRRLKYDFWVPDMNLLLEYDGPQHVIVGMKIRGGACNNTTRFG